MAATATATEAATSTPVFYLTPGVLVPFLQVILKRSSLSFCMPVGALLLLLLLIPTYSLSQSHPHTAISFHHCTKSFCPLAVSSFTFTSIFFLSAFAFWENRVLNLGSPRSLSWAKKKKTEKKDEGLECTSTFVDVVCIESKKKKN